MAKYRGEEEQSYLIKYISSYREQINQKENHEAKRLTKELANYIHESYPSIRSQSVNAIYERLPYLDNLLAGVFEQTAYVIKDRHLYSTHLREDKNKKPNLCNTRNPYNGAMK